MKNSERCKVCTVCLYTIGRDYPPFKATSHLRLPAVRGYRTSKATCGSMLLATRGDLLFEATRHLKLPTVRGCPTPPYLFQNFYWRSPMRMNRANDQKMIKINSSFNANFSVGLIHCKPLRSSINNLETPLSHYLHYSDIRVTQIFRYPKRFTRV